MVGNSETKEGRKEAVLNSSAGRDVESYKERQILNGVTKSFESLWFQMYFKQYIFFSQHACLLKALFKNVSTFNNLSCMYSTYMLYQSL